MPNRRSEKDQAVTDLLDRLDLERPLADNIRFASRAEPWRYTGVTCLVARDGQGTPVGFLSGRLSKNDGSLPGRVAFVEMIGVVRAMAVRDRDDRLTRTGLFTSDDSFLLRAGIRCCPVAI
ncbi:hypothetical protein ACTG9Q_31515 [Actinokineospora sp. 24-640]